MGELKLTKIKASSLIEVVVAMVIIVMILGIAATIYFQVSASTNLLRKVQATLILDSIAHATDLNQTFYDETINLNGIYKIEKKIISYQSSVNLIELNLSIYDPEKGLIATRKQLINVSDDE